MTCRSVPVRFSLLVLPGHQRDHHSHMGSTLRHCRVSRPKDANTGKVATVQCDLFCYSTASGYIEHHQPPRGRPFFINQQCVSSHAASLLLVMYVVLVSSIPNSSAIPHAILFKNLCYCLGNPCESHMPAVAPQPSPPPKSSSRFTLPPGVKPVLLGLFC
jgi:hypothetical protein